MIVCTITSVGMVTKLSQNQQERELNMKYSDSVRRAVATFIFAFIGVAAGSASGQLEISDSAIWAGVGAVLNLAYRAAEAYVKARAYTQD